MIHTVASPGLVVAKWDDGRGEEQYRLDSGRGFVHEPHYLRVQEFRTLRFQYTPPVPVVAEPLQVGSEWSYRGTEKCIERMKDAKKSRVIQTTELNFVKTAVRTEAVEVPAGRFTALRVSVSYYDTRHQENWKQVEWYAEGVGLVKRTGQEQTNGITRFVPFTEVLVSYHVH